LDYRHKLLTHRGHDWTPMQGQYSKPIDNSSDGARVFGLIEVLILRLSFPEPWNWIIQVILLIVLLLIFLSWLMKVSGVEVPGAT
jgi:hypothetical protein